MAADDRPQLCLVTPAALTAAPLPEDFARQLGAVLDAAEVACLRIAVAGQDEAAIGRAADTLRLIAHERDIACVIDSHVQLATRHGLDGVHLTDGARNIRAARKVLGADAIVGAYCGASRHDGMSAGEAGADYVAFGPVGQSALGLTPPADLEIFEWWSEMIEVPVIAEGGLTADLVAALAPVTDFFSIGPEIWTAEDPAAALRALLAPLG